MSNQSSHLPLQVLLVDDDPDFLSYLLSAAEPFNILIQTCSSRQAAQKMIQSSTYGAYIIDLNLPDGSGFNLIEEIRKKDKQSPVAVISATYEESFQTMKEKYGITYILNKPIYPEQIENLLSNFCIQPHQTAPTKNPKFQNLKREYDKTISSKIDLLTKLVHAVHHHSDTASLTALKEAVHKIGGSAGSYGYPHVSTLCEELDYDLRKKLESNAPIEKEWLADLNSFLNNIKFHYQITPVSADQSLSAPSFVGERSSLFIVDSDQEFLKLIEREKDLFPIKVEYESNPEIALKRLSTPDFNPRAVIIAQTFAASPITAYDIIDTMRQKVGYLPTLFGILLSEHNIDMRIEAAQKGIKYVFLKPTSPYMLLKTMTNIVEKDYQRNFKVLIVDDDLDVCQFVSTALGEVGVDVRCLYDPTRLYQVLEEYKPYVLLLDVLLPKYNGLNLLKTVRADLAYQNLIILIITVHNDPAIEKEAYLDNADDILYKPLDKTLLQQRVLNLLKRHALSGEFNGKTWIGLDEFEALLSTLREALLKPRYVTQYLVLFEVDHFADLALQKGQTFTHDLLILVSNLLRRITTHTVLPFFYKDSQFALIFEGYDLKAIEEEMLRLLLLVKNEFKFDLSFSCGIMPITRNLGNAHKILNLAEETLVKAQHKEPATVKIATYLPQGETIQKKEVILIDPDKDLLNLLQQTFESHGMTVKTFTTGEEALRVLLSYQEGNLPALIISERKLSDMEGIEILKRLKSRFHQLIPFYFLTVYASDKDISEGLAQGALDYITKPFNLSLLVQKAIKTIFHQQSAALE